MNLNGLELKILEGLLSLFVIAVGTVITKYGPIVKKWIDKHLPKHDAQTANTIIDGLSKIAEATVQDFNQRVVHDAKRNGVFTPQLAQSVKQDAVKAIEAHGSGLVKLGKESLGDVESLIGPLVEQYVTKHHIPTAHLQKSAQPENGQAQNDSQN